MTSSLNVDSKDKHESVVVDSSLASTPTPNTTTTTATAPPPTNLSFETTKLNSETTQLNFEADEVVTTVTTTLTTMTEDGFGQVRTDFATPQQHTSQTFVYAESNVRKANKPQVTIINTVNGVKAELMPALNSETSGDGIVIDKENVSHLNSNANDVDAVIKNEQAVR